MLEDYMASLSEIRKLSREEETLLWKQYKEDGDQDARGTIVENYQLLVFREAMKYHVQETVMMDLIQEGTVGLMEAVERYNPKLGVAFSLYAVHRVRGRILDFLKTQTNEVPMESAEAEEAMALAAPDLAFETADRSFLQSAVGHAMQRLPEREKDVIRSVYLQEQTVAETAGDMDVSTAYVYRLEKRGIRRLRGMLSKVMHDRK
jgi:RNA polymerase sigma factor (sigma-70 family)